ncbi:MAG TPA: tetratricopeptide repeat protein, partial [Gemmatimonadales bacterium]|nr:tetratricopeptide repeat protein [Gemmatimonadales bacterium]
RVVPHLGIVPTLAMAPGAEGAVDLLPPEWEVLAAIDGTRDLRALAAHLGRSEFDVAKTVFGLHAAGVLEVIDPGMQRNRAPGDLDADEALSRVEALLKVRELEAARAEAEVAVTTYPQEAGAHVALAGVHLAAGRAREAEDAARHALRLDPMRGAAHRMLGDALALEGRFAEAVEWWERWLTLADSDESETPERERVRAATDAARTLDQVLRGAHGR